MFIDFRERGREGGGERDRGREENRYIDWLPLIHALTGDQTCNLALCLTRNRTLNLLVYRTMLQPTEPHQQGLSSIL